MKWFERRSYFLNCNWKVFVDNYLDGGYHVPHIHTGLSSVLDNSKYKIETGQRFCLQSSPVAAGKGEAQTAAVRKGERAHYLWIYPNFMINLYHGYMDTNLVLPDGVDRCTVIFDFYFDDVIEGRGTWPSHLALIMYWLLVPFAIGGLVVLRRRRVPISPYLVLAGIVTLSAAVASSTVDIVDLNAWEVLNSLDIAKRGEPGAHGLAYIPRAD